ncbi:MAG: DUF374 domain-containing protein [Calditrichaeota bacterium]|nr:MAG: DUF374 domain-containing protein [Calditrichota bacterium]
MNKKQLKKVVQYIALKTAWLLILLLGKTARITVKNGRFLRQAYASKAPILFLAWHGRMLLPVYIHRGQRVVAMVSEHTDGEIIAQTVTRLGFRTVRGSSTRGGRKAFRDMLHHLRRGEHCTILPDGPQGPALEIKSGAILLAQLSGAVILPITFAAEKAITIQSWDRFTLWRPFSRVLLIYGEPIKLPRKMGQQEVEEKRTMVEQKMRKLLADVDEMVGK